MLINKIETEEITKDEFIDTIVIETDECPYTYNLNCEISDSCEGTDEMNI